MPQIISASEFLKKSQAFLQSGKIKQKVEQLTLSDQNGTIKKAKINEFEFGLRPNFKKIGLYSNDAYAQKKYLLNPLAGFDQVDGILTGNTVGSLFTQKKGDSFIFKARYQWANLIKRYGQDLEGLNQKTFEKIQTQEQAPILAKYINEELGLK